LQKAFYEFLVEISRVQEGSYTLDRDWSFLISYGLQLLKVRPHPFSRHDMPQEVHLLLGKVTFHPIGKDFIFTVFIQNIFQMFCMFFRRLGIHQDIVNINDHKSI